MLAIVVVALIAVVALAALSATVHFLFSPWLLLLAVAILAWIKLRPSHSRQ